jgi:predicted nuclease with RNAse H fold
MRAASCGEWEWRVRESGVRELGVSMREEERRATALSLEFDVVVVDAPLSFCSRAKFALSSFSFKLTTA